VSEFLVITGLSGAGRSSAAAALEDIGWFVIDNLPPSLIAKVAELVGRPGSDTERVALVIGRGGGDHLDEVRHAIDGLRSTGSRVTVLFLDAPDPVLVRRFEGTRRRHPVEAEGVTAAISRERSLLAPIKDDADVVLDTGELNVNQLRSWLLERFSLRDTTARMQLAVVSFGYKHGLPLDVDLVFDCRFLPNPHWVEELRPLTGLDPAVRDYVMGQDDTGPFLDRVEDLLALVLPAYVREGRSYLSIAVGCTGGRHRSVVLAEELGRRIAGQGYDPSVVHRDVDR
jgi:RNase adapter protein RapZ